MIDHKGRLTCRRQLSECERRRILDLAAMIGWGYSVNRDQSSESGYTLSITGPSADSSTRMNCWHLGSVKNETLACLMLAGSHFEAFKKALGLFGNLDLLLALSVNRGEGAMTT